MYDDQRTRPPRPTQRGREVPRRLAQSMIGGIVLQPIKTFMLLPGVMVKGPQVAGHMAVSLSGGYEPLRSLHDDAAIDEREIGVDAESRFGRVPLGVKKIEGINLTLGDAELLRGRVE